MARATITINNGVTLTAQATTDGKADTATYYKNASLGIMPTRTDLSGNTWQQASIELRVANGTAGPVWGKPIWLYYAFSRLSFTASTAPAVFVNPGKIELPLSNTASAVKIVVASPVYVNDYLYTWISLPEPILKDVTITTVITQVV